MMMKKELLDTLNGGRLHNLDIKNLTVSMYGCETCGFIPNTGEVRRFLRNLSKIFFGEPEKLSSDILTGENIEDDYPSYTQEMIGRNG